MPRPLLAPAWLLVCLSSCVDLSETVTTPQRPTLNYDTSTTRAGTLELESGVAVDPGDSFVAPVTLKAGWNDTRELYASWSAYEAYASTPDAPEVQGTGDIYIGFRERVYSKPEAGATAAFQAELKLPTAKKPIGSGETGVRAALIGNRAWERVALNAYYRLSVEGDPNTNGFDYEHALSIAASGALAGPVGAFAEIAAQIPQEVSGQPSRPTQIYSTLGLQFALSPQVVLDLGTVVGLNNEVPAVRIIAGLTWNLGRFF